MLVTEPRQPHDYHQQDDQRQQVDRQQPEQEAAVPAERAAQLQKDRGPDRRRDQHAGHEHPAGQAEHARTVYRQISDGTWQERFAATVERARGLVGN